MTKTEAIEILQPLRDMMVDQHGCPISDAVYALDWAIETLKQPEQRWIPIGSNPITTGLYLVLCNEWGKSMYRICAYYSEAGKWIENGKNITKSITHWMPLPEPYKVGVE